MITINRLTTGQEIKERRERVVKKWAELYPTKDRPKSCIDCGRVSCFLDCKGIDDERVEEDVLSY
jgi:hypothetical protein